MEGALDLSAEEDGDEEGELVSGETEVLTLPEAGAVVTSWRLILGAASVPLTCVERVLRKGSELEVDARDGRRLLVTAPGPTLDRLRDAVAPPVPFERVFAFANPQVRGRLPGMELLATLGPAPLPDGVRVVPQPDYALCETYPPVLVVPSAATDAELARIARFRSRGRLPVMSSGGGGRGLVMRCAQPKAGPTQRGCREDEAMLAPFSSLLLFDARPRAAAVGNAARGGGTERATRYAGAQLLFGDIANIHALRKDGKALYAACRSSSDAEWPAASTAWLRQVASVLRGADVVAAHAGGEAAHPVLVHCSDGWDRTAQVCSLAALLLHPRHRTLKGFLQVVSREWVLLGHRFALRLGTAGGPEDESSPVFLLFLDCVHQLLLQHPRAFAFDASLLVAMMDAALSGRFGTFLCDSEKERAEKGVASGTPCFLAWALRRQGQFANRRYLLQDRVLSASSSLKRLRVWDDWFLRYQ